MGRLLDHYFRESPSHTIKNISDKLNNRGTTLAHFAAGERGVEMLEELLEEIHMRESTRSGRCQLQIKVFETPNSNGILPVHIAAAHRRPGNLQFLVEKCCPSGVRNLLEKDRKGFTVAHHAAIHKDFDSMKYIVANSPLGLDSLLERSSKGITPLLLLMKHCGNFILTVKYFSLIKSWFLERPELLFHLPEDVVERTFIVSVRSRFRDLRSVIISWIVARPKLMNLVPIILRGIVLSELIDLEIQVVPLDNKLTLTNLALDIVSQENTVKFREELLRRRRECDL